MFEFQQIISYLLEQDILSEMETEENGEERQWLNQDFEGQPAKNEGNIGMTEVLAHIVFHKL